MQLRKFMMHQKTFPRKFDQRNKDSSSSLILHPPRVFHASLLPPNNSIIANLQLPIGLFALTEVMLGLGSKRTPTANFFPRCSETWDLKFGISRDCFSYRSTFAYPNPVRTTGIIKGGHIVIKLLFYSKELILKE